VLARFCLGKKMETTDTKECPFCSEPIRATAKKCVHCGEFLGPPSWEWVFGDQVEGYKTHAGDVDDFTLAYLRGFELSGAYLSGMDLFGAHLVAANLRGADLGVVNLINADLTKADLSGANLTGADLSDANLSGANLRGANLIGADLNGALYDDLTIWPDGFDPPSAGAINIVNVR
jgi:hypothetical protein